MPNRVHRGQGQGKGQNTYTPFSTHWSASSTVLEVRERGVAGLSCPLCKWCFLAPSHLGRVGLPHPSIKCTSASRLRGRKVVLDRFVQCSQYPRCLHHYKGRFEIVCTLKVCLLQHLRVSVCPSCQAADCSCPGFDPCYCVQPFE